MRLLLKKILCTQQVQERTLLRLFNTKSLAFATQWPKSEQQWENYSIFLRLKLSGGQNSTKTFTFTRGMITSKSQYKQLKKAGRL